MNTQPETTGQGRSKATILMVEDSPMQARGLSRILESNRYVVVSAQNGVEALALIRRQRPGLVLSDILMPLMDGFTLCDTIKKDPALAGLPVILLTTLSEPQDIVQALAVGADDYIMKPYEEETLLVKIAQALGPTDRQTVRRNGNGFRILLAGTEFVVPDNSRQILKLLLSTYENAIRQNREILAAAVENQVVNRKLAQKVKELEQSQLELQRLNEQLAINMTELSVSEEKYRTLVDTVPDIVYKIDPDGCFTFLNDAVEKLGYKPSELIGQHFSDMMLPAEVKKVSRSSYSANGRGGQTVDATAAPKLFDERRTGKRKTTGLEIYLLSKDQRRFPALVRSAIDPSTVVEVNSAGMYQEKITLEERAFVGTVGVIRDITYRKRMEEELRQSRDQLEIRVMERTAELRRTYETQHVLHAMLSLSLQDIPLDDLLPLLLDLIISAPLQGVDPCGCILLFESGKLVMKSRRELNGRAEKVGVNVPLAQCPCAAVAGAATTGELQFITPIQGHEEDGQKGPPRHGYYCLPIRTDDTILGVMGMHAGDGKEVDAATAATLQTIACNLAGIILRKQGQQEIQDYAENLERVVAERTGELQEALQTTKRDSEKIDAILSSVADGLIVINNSHQVILMNPAAEALLGVSLNQIVHKPIEFAVQIATLRDRLVNVLTEKEVGYEFDFEMPGASDDQHRIMRGKTSSVKDGSGKQVGIVILITDVTHEREVDRLKTEFLSTAAHELRTPLTSIQGFSEILATRDNLGAGEQRRFLSYINKQAVNLANIVNDLLDISRIESGRSFAINKEPCFAEEWIGSVVPCVQDSSGQHALIVELPDHPVELVVDHAKMGQVLKNLLSNAIKYSPAGGAICIRGEDLGDHFALSVQDQGIGMTQEQLTKVFEKFYRVDASDSAPEGTGLGMTIVKYIVEAHGGEVTIESEIGVGTTVRFSIPKNGFAHSARGGRKDEDDYDCR